MSNNNESARIIAAILILSFGLSLKAQTQSTYLSELNGLKDKFKITFVYDSSLPLERNSRSVRSRWSLDRSMHYLLEDSGMEYEIMGETVVISRAKNNTIVSFEPPVVMFDTLRPARIEYALRDTFHIAKTFSNQEVSRNAGTRIVALPDMRKIVAPTGEADAIKYIQTLPGVSTGAEGSSAIYVRGGNIGSNLSTLDGVSLYGGSHLLGLTSVYPTDIISSVNFRVGGFHGDENNITASHISLQTKDGSFTMPSYTVSASTFIWGGTVSMPLVRNRVSLLGSVRVSPLGSAFRLVQSAVGGALDSLSRPQAVVYDTFAKAKWLIDDTHSLSLSVFNSMDAYGYVYGGDSEENMGWDNLVVSARHEGSLGHGWMIEDGLAYNRFCGRQGVVRDMNGKMNNLAIVSSLDEITADIVFSHSLAKVGDLHVGVRERFAVFNPGTSATFSGSGLLKRLDSPRSDHKRFSNIITLYSQWSLSDGDHYEFMASGRINKYTANEPGDPTENSLNPEAGFLARVNITKWLAVEATADWMTQFYHTLEGIPLGWSVDLMVPSCQSRPPEQARQFYAGLFTSFGRHRFTAGAYDKCMSNLVYFLDAGMLFSPVISGWNNNIKVGSGTSQGIELLYEKEGERLNYRVSYTFSKTDRTFEKVNEGETFPAKFDRRHVLSATASITLLDNDVTRMALTGLYTYQSGHRETVPAGEHLAYSFFGKEITLNYFSCVNNYEMPAYIRLDLGCRVEFKTKCPQDFTFGVYNVLNRHNPFSVFYDDRSCEWCQISLIPIMPSFSYRIHF